MTPEQAALALRSDLQLVARRSVALVWQLWDQIDPGGITASWDQLLARASSILVAAQTVSAEMADPYLAAAKPVARVASVTADGFAGWADGSLTVVDLLEQGAPKALKLVSRGMPAPAALRQTRATMAKYVATTSVDAGRLATTAAMATRPQVTGYYRMLVGKSCPRCAILAGRFYRLNEGFKRHPGCDCIHRPASQAGDGSAFDARKAIERGDVTGLSKADRKAILELGADPSQVVNAKAGMFEAGGRKFTTQGTSKSALGAQRLRRLDPKAIEAYAQRLRAGTTFSPAKIPGYRFGKITVPRPTPEAILGVAKSRDEALKMLRDFGYVI